MEKAKKISRNVGKILLKYPALALKCPKCEKEIVKFDKFEVSKVAGGILNIGIMCRKCRTKWPSMVQITG